MIERAQLVTLFLKQPNIVGHAIEPFQGHAAADPAHDRASLIAAEIDARRIADQTEDFLQVGFVQLIDRFLCGRIGPRGQIRVAADPSQLLCNTGRIEDIIDASREHGAARHTVVRRGFVVLGEGDALNVLDGLDSQCPVSAAPRENHADGAPD